jgi:uncharacterized SAM-binding protein YcdF (DUF218 family)
MSEVPVEGEGVGRRDRGAWRHVRMLPALLGAALALWLGGLAWFTAAIPTRIADSETPTDAVVVLTGGSQRLAAGLDLLGAGKARKLLVTGVHPGVAVGDLLRVSRHAPEQLLCCIVLGHEAADTLGNAAETAAWVRREGYGSLRLVTASYHMPRALVEFARAMPEIRILAHPVFPERLDAAHWWSSPSAAELVIGEYHKFIGAWLRARWLGASPPAVLEAAPA